MPKKPPAYRQFYSTETAATKVFNDLLLAADGGKMSALCLLYLTAAFDTVDHELLLLRLERHRTALVQVVPVRQNVIYLFIYYELRTEYTNIKTSKIKKIKYSLYNKSISSLLYSVILTKLCLMYNNSRITFMFEKSESDNTLLFTVVQAILLLIDAS